MATLGEAARGTMFSGQAVDSAPCRVTARSFQQPLGRAVRRRAVDAKCSCKSLHDAPILSGAGRSSGGPAVARSRWLQLMRAAAGASRWRLVPCGIKVAFPQIARRDDGLRLW